MAGVEPARSTPQLHSRSIMLRRWMLAVGWTCEIRVCIRVMRHGRLGTIDGADRLAILTLDACHVQTRRAPVFSGGAGAPFGAARGGLARAARPALMCLGKRCCWAAHAAQSSESSIESSIESCSGRHMPRHENRSLRRVAADGFPVAEPSE